MWLQEKGLEYMLDIAEVDSTARSIVDLLFPVLIWTVTDIGYCSEADVNIVIFKPYI